MALLREYQRVWVTLPGGFMTFLVHRLARSEFIDEFVGARYGPYEWEAYDLYVMRQEEVENQSAKAGE